MPPDPASVRRVHESLLERLRRSMDLVGPGPAAPHFDDAEQVATLLTQEPPRSGRWADLGSGAGFPGIALAAHHPGIRVELVESRQKRATFLELLVREAELENAVVRRMRVEDLERGSYDGVISRAFAPPADYLATARGLLRPLGEAWLLLARESAPAVDGLVLESERAYTVGDRDRRLCGYRRMP